MLNYVRRRCHRLAPVAGRARMHQKHHIAIAEKQLKQSSSLTAHKIPILNPRPSVDFAFERRTRRRKRANILWRARVKLQLSVLVNSRHFALWILRELQYVTLMVKLREQWTRRATRLFHSTACCWECISVFSLLRVKTVGCKICKYIWNWFRSNWTRHVAGCSEIISLH